ncbi:MAG: extracellular solute-binding protein, partial [Pseudomonadota bacterium]
MTEETDRPTALHSPSLPLSSLRMTRRLFTGLGTAAIGTAAIGTAMLPGQLLAAAGKGPVHGLSAFGDLKYPAGFAHYDYANPNAPKGGTWSTGYGNTTYDSFNSFVLKGNPAIGVSAFIYDGLMTSSADEPDSVYGLIAETAELAEDGTSVVFNLRPEARFHDGKQITAEDVVFTFDTLITQGHPSYRVQLAAVKSATAESPSRVRYDFDPNAPLRDLPMMVSGLPVLPKHYYEGRDFTESTLDVPLGSGAYEIGRFEPGAYVNFTRVDDYWAKDLGVNVGRNNFDIIRIDYFRDRTAQFEGFKGGAFLFNEEFWSKLWATGYSPEEFPAVARGDVITEVLPDERPAGSQGYWFNLRRKKFQDARVREAIAICFDFEWSNQRLFYNLYNRTDSFFEGGPMQADGPPTPGEAAILEKFADKLPDGVLDQPAYVPPVTDGS